MHRSARLARATTLHQGLPSAMTTAFTARVRRIAREWGPQVLVLLVVFLGVRAWQLRGAAEGTAPPVIGRSIHAPDQLLSLEALRGRPAVV